MREKINRGVMDQMQSRVRAGLDPLSGRPMQIVGTVAWRKGVLCDEAGTEVTLSKHGDWVPVKK